MKTNRIIIKEFERSEWTQTWFWEIKSNVVDRLESTEIETAFKK